MVSKFPLFTPSALVSKPDSTMKATERTGVVLFTLFLIHIIVCSLLSHDNGIISNLYDSDPQPPRKLLAYFGSISASVDKLKAATGAPERSVNTNLKKAPPSKSNPTHNK